MRKNFIHQISDYMEEQLNAKGYENNDKDIGGHNPYLFISKIFELPFDEFRIPAYQRPYKWRAKHVNQLINDILLFKNKSAYRLGSIVLHNNEIVDGQQRIITLSLLLYTLFDIYKPNCKSPQYNSFYQKLTTFCNSINIQNKYSFFNIIENWHVIQNRINELDETSLKFIMEKCEFVLIRLSNLSEAFQFFDSQNARGKDLEPHDLLKAFHLREICHFSQEDNLNISFWQKQQTPDMRYFFLMLFRAKLWSHGRSARFFTKDDTKIFKGVSISDAYRYPFYQMEIIAHIYTEDYNTSNDRLIDKHKMEFPYNLDDQIINGSRFFDMIHHYWELKEKIDNIDTFINYPQAYSILKIINGKDGYHGSNRVGDRYVKEMFNTLLLYYIDRYGFEEINKIVVQFFIWAYSLRINHSSVQQVTMDKYATDTNSMFKKVFESQIPYDIINITLPYIERANCTKCDVIKEKFVELKKLKEYE